VFFRLLDNKQEKHVNKFRRADHTIMVSWLSLAFVCVIAITAGEKFRTSAAAQDDRSDEKTEKKKEIPKPVLLKDINPGLESSSPAMFVEFNGAVYFRANDGMHGIELWKTDGTLAGTSLVTDLNPGAANALPGELRVAGGSLYFNAFTEPTGSKVFKSDGTAAGTILLVDTNPGQVSGPFGPPLPGNFKTFGNLVLFTATDSKAGDELWRTDGTIGGTYLVKDIHPGLEWSVPVGLTPFAGRVIFAADDSFINDDNGFRIYNRELFTTDGTDAGTFRIKDINPGPLPSIPVGFTVFRKQLFFRAGDETTGAELWTTDGTEAGTRLFKDINPAGSSFPENLTAAGNRLFFIADDGVTGTELWVSNGKEKGTHLVKDINPNGASTPLNLTAVGNRLFFTADDGVHGIELWVSDGTAAGTHLVKDINPGAERSAPSDLLAVGHLVFFTAIKPNDAKRTVTTQLWVTDGTEDGTRLVWQEPGQSVGYSINNLTLLGDRLLFSAPSGVDAEGISINTELYSLVVPSHLRSN
jgi:ELWxxDGT repeat protein